MPALRIGSRDSVLALWQTRWVINQLKRFQPDLECEIVPIKTTGDKILDVALAKIGDKGLFTKELEISLREGQIDVAVHSLKDLPTELPEGCSLGVVCQRTEPADVLISRQNWGLKDLPSGARVGTSSLRRKAQLLNFRPDLQPEDLRGNVLTRLRKMEEQGLEAIVLAAAGVERLDLNDRITEYLPYSICLPAVGQGAIALEIRTGDQEALRLIQALHDVNCALAVSAERALLKRLEGGCQIPIAALGQIQGGKLILEGRVISIDGQQLVEGSRAVELTGLEDTGGLDMAIPERLGRELAEELLERGAHDILKQLCVNL